ncbi:MAG: DUF3836 domain-containing protein [Prevotellaceae bacterium]|jgi:hypothetical protein|nr:DUF3836 domain-containing protein [Prevotellaceae bacterium]
MKKKIFTTLMICVLGTTALWAQSTMRLDSVITKNEAGSSVKTMFSYDTDGNKTTTAYKRGRTAWIEDTKKYEEYDTNGNMKLESSYHWDTNLQDWVGNYKYERDYDSNKLLEVFYTWNSELKDWRRGSKSVREYDSNNNMTYYAVATWNSELEEFQYYIIHEYEFNASGRQIMRADRWKNTETEKWEGTKGETIYNENGDIFTRYIWNDELKDWEIEEKIKTETIYNENGDIFTRYVWNNGLNDWEIEEKTKTEYERNANGNVITSISYQWNVELNIWETKSKNTQEYEYNANGKITLQTTTTFNYEVEEWVETRKIKIESAYDAKGNNTLSASYAWNYTTQKWISRGTEPKYTREYDNNNNVISDIEYTIYNSDLEQWQETYIREYSYDNDKNLLSSSSRQWRDDKYGSRWSGSKSEFEYNNGNIQLEKTYSWDTDDWVLSAVTTYYYTEILSALPAVSAEKQIQKEKYFTLNGTPAKPTTKGIIIKHIIYTDGTVKTEKELK